jgi:hypothetical protein
MDYGFIVVQARTTTLLLPLPFPMRHRYAFGMHTVVHNNGCLVDTQRVVSTSSTRWCKLLSPSSSCGRARDEKAPRNYLERENLLLSKCCLLNELFYSNSTRPGAPECLQLTRRMTSGA